jgi:hypothetical protein
MLLKAESVPVPVSGPESGPESVAESVPAAESAPSCPPGRTSGTQHRMSAGSWRSRCWPNCQRISCHKGRLRLHCKGWTLSHRRAHLMHRPRMEVRCRPGPKPGTRTRPAHNCTNSHREGPWRNHCRTNCSPRNFGFANTECRQRNRTRSRGQHGHRQCHLICTEYRLRSWLGLPRGRYILQT